MFTTNYKIDQQPTNIPCQTGLQLLWRKTNFSNTEIIISNGLVWRPSRNQLPDLLEFGVLQIYLWCPGGSAPSLLPIVPRLTSGRLTGVTAGRSIRLVSTRRRNPLEGNYQSIQAAAQHQQLGLFSRGAQQGPLVHPSDALINLSDSDTNTDRHA